MEKEKVFIDVRLSTSTEKSTLRSSDGRYLHVLFLYSKKPVHQLTEKYSELARAKKILRITGYRKENDDLIFGGFLSVWSSQNVWAGIRPFLGLPQHG